MIRSELEEIKIHFYKVLSSLSVDVDKKVWDSMNIWDTPEVAFGDYTTNIAMRYARELKVNPKELAEKLAIQGGKHGFSVAGPGFINIRLASATVRSAYHEVGVVSTKYSGLSVLVEHTSINLFKPFSMGHLLNNITGEYVVRALKAGGANVRSICFPSDISLGIAKAVYIIKKNKIDLDDATIQNDNIIKTLGEAYRLGVIEYDDSESAREDVKIIANNLYSGVGEDYESYKKAKSYNLEYFDNFLDFVHSAFDLPHIYESEAGVRGREIILSRPDIFYKSEGAVVYTPSEDRKDIHTGVFINSEGHPTYGAKDVGLIDLKFRKYNPDLSITIADNEQAQHFALVLDAYEKIDDKTSPKQKYITHGRMTWKGAKMSSRLGGVPLAEEIIEDLINRVTERTSDKLASHSEQSREQIIKEVALSAIKVAILRSRPGLNINFDPDTSLSFEGDSGPYLQYTAARCSSLITKSNLNIEDYKNINSSQDPSNLERELSRYNYVLLDSSENLEPQKLVTYLIGVAREFNSHYASTPIIVEDLDIKMQNIKLVDWTKRVLHHGLHILGIEAIENI